MDIALDPGIAEGTDQDGIEVAGQHGESIRRNGGLIAEVAVCAPVKFGEVKRGPGGLHHFYSLRDHFLANAVAGNYGDALACLLLLLHGMER